MFSGLARIWSPIGLSVARYKEVWAQHCYAAGSRHGTRPGCHQAASPFVPLRATIGELAVNSSALGAHSAGLLTTTRRLQEPSQRHTDPTECQNITNPLRAKRQPLTHWRMTGYDCWPNAALIEVAHGDQARGVRPVGEQADRRCH
jgi:hypothetical protein